MSTPSRHHATRLGRGQLRRPMQHLMNEMTTSTESADMHVLRIAWGIKIS